MTFDEWWATYDPDDVNTSADRSFAAMVWAEAVAAERERTAQHVRNLCEVAGAILHHLVPGAAREGEPVPDAATIAARIREGNR